MNIEHYNETYPHLPAFLLPPASTVPVTVAGERSRTGAPLLPFRHAPPDTLSFLDSVPGLLIGLKELALMKPAAIRTMYETELYRQHTGFDDDTQSDSYFQQIAARQGKQVIGLESVDMQIALLFGNDDQKQEALLLVETVSHREEGLQEIETLNALYKVGEIDRLVKMAQEQGDPLAMTPEEYDCMVDERNQAWAEQLPDLMQARPCFIAVEAMHLGGEKGLVQLLLRKEGNKILISSL